MQTTKRALGLITSIVLMAAGSAPAETNWTGGARPGGNGFYLSAPDQGFNLNFLGYGQFVGTILDHQYRAVRSDLPFAFNIRRARLTTLATVQRDAEFMVELGTPTMRTVPTNTVFPNSGVPTVPTGTATAGTVDPGTIGPAFNHALFQGNPDLAIVEARATVALFDEWLQLRVGKFTGPFSTENSRSSRFLDVIERSNVLSSLLLVPAIDTQLGAMLFGRAAGGIINYYFAAFNGNGNSTVTTTDNDGTKEFQFKLTVHPHKNFTASIGWDTDQMPLRPLSLVDHSLTPVVTGGVFGTRHGISFDWDWTVDWFNWKTELLFILFTEANLGNNYVRGLAGGYTQFNFKLWGDTSRGVELVPRLEYSVLRMGRAYELYSGILGFNFHINSNLTNTVNYIVEYMPRGVGAGIYANTGAHHMFMNQLQIKF